MLSVFRRSSIMEYMFRRLQSVSNWYWLMQKVENSGVTNMHSYIRIHINLQNSTHDPIPPHLVPFQSTTPTSLNIDCPCSSCLDTWRSRLPYRCLTSKRGNPFISHAVVPLSRLSATYSQPAKQHVSQLSSNIWKHESIVEGCV